MISVWKCPLFKEDRLAGQGASSDLIIQPQFSLSTLGLQQAWERIPSGRSKAGCHRRTAVWSYLHPFRFGLNRHRKGSSQTFRSIFTHTF